jgi:acetyl/propionyl-CoA carboxylase alpha subunit
VVGVEYDPLLAKLIVYGETRTAAIARARRAVNDWIVLGVETNRAALDAVLGSPEFRSGSYATDLVSKLPPRPDPTDAPDAAWIAAALAASLPATAAQASESAAPANDPWDAAAGWRASS